MSNTEIDSKGVIEEYVNIMAIILTSLTQSHQAESFIRVMKGS